MRDKEKPYVYIVQGCVDARDLTFKDLPELVEICPICEANGKRQQYYMEGAMTGPCGFCNASGFVYHNTANGVPISVTNQIAVRNHLSFRCFESHGIDWLKDAP
jgi:hypothetical protein